jgi:hypothetical protein
MAVTDFNPAQKPHVYDLLNRLNAAFARANRNIDALGQTGIFDPQTIERLHRLQEEARADTNSRLLLLHHLFRTASGTAAGADARGRSLGPQGPGMPD